MWNKDSPLGNKDSPLGNKDSALGNKDSALGNKDSPLGNHELTPTTLEQNSGVSTAGEEIRQIVKGGRLGFVLTFKTAAKVSGIVYL